MNLQAARIESGGSKMRSVLQCGAAAPLSTGARSRPLEQSARELVQPKTWRTFVTVLGFAAVSINAHAQYSIDWHTIDGGGGTSTGGVYSVSGTIGQPDAGGPMTNGQYSVTGGFWALPTAVQTAGAPTLTISRDAPGYALVSWTPNTPGFVLEETWSLSPSNWTNSPSGAANPVVVPATLPSKFYRLHQP
jgi:hypothetical protein